MRQQEVSIALALLLLGARPTAALEDPRYEGRHWQRATLTHLDELQRYRAGFPGYEGGMPWPGDFPQRAQSFENGSGAVLRWRRGLGCRSATESDCGAESVVTMYLSAQDVRRGSASFSDRSTDSVAVAYSHGGHGLDGTTDCFGYATDGSVALHMAPDSRITATVSVVFRRVDLLAFPKMCDDERFSGTFTLDTWEVAKPSAALRPESP